MFSSLKSVAQNQTFVSSIYITALYRPNRFSLHHQHHQKPLFFRAFFQPNFFPILAFISRVLWCVQRFAPSLNTPHFAGQFYLQDILFPLRVFLSAHSLCFQLQKNEKKKGFTAIVEFSSVSFFAGLLSIFRQKNVTLILKKKISALLLIENHY